MAKFDLTREPWIRVRKGTDVFEVSLRDVFKNAHEIGALSGELATQDAAMLRLLLAVLYAIFTRVDVNGRDAPLEDYNDAIQRWHELWEKGSFPGSVIDKYFDEFADRFDLFDETRPFMQVPFGAANDDNGEAEAMCRDGTIICPFVLSNAAFIGDISDSNAINLFARRNGDNPISFAQAARWMIHLNSFAVSPPGRQPKGKKKIQGYGLPWPARFDIIYAEGGNLFETLMFNFALWVNEAPVNLFIPPWEENALITADDLLNVKLQVPNNTGKLFATVFRWAQLVLTDDGNMVNGCNVWSGGKFPDDAPILCETMAALHEAKKYKPKKSDATKQLWRDFGALTSGSTGISRWISNELKLRAIVRMQIVNMTYAKNTRVSGCFSDSLTLNAKLLSELGKAWANDITRLLSHTDQAVKSLGDLTEDLFRASGGSKILKEGNRTMEQAYYELDEPFREWLLGIDPDRSDPINTSNSWKRTAKQIITREGDKLVSQVGNKAFVGRFVKEAGIKDKARYMSAPQAYEKFKKELKKILGGEELNG